MTTTYRYAWLAVLDSKGRKNLNDELLDLDDAHPALMQQSQPGAVWVIQWDNAPARLATTALSRNIGKDQDIEVVVVSVQGDENKMRDWIDTPQGKCLRSHALSVQPWVYSATTA
jgi:hypothetical protein